MLAEKGNDQIRRRQPLLIGVPLVLNHCCKSIELAGELTAQGLFTRCVHEAQKRGQPRFDGDKLSTLTEHACRFGENLIAPGTLMISMTIQARRNCPGLLALPARVTGIPLLRTGLLI